MKYLRNKNFFRYDSRGKKKKSKKIEMIDLTAPDKLRLRDVWKNANYVEKVFMLSSFVVVGLIWIINTVSGFIG